MCVGSCTPMGARSGVCGGGIVCFVGFGRFGAVWGCTVVGVVCAVVNGCVLAPARGLRSVCSMPRLCTVSCVFMCAPQDGDVEGCVRELSTFVGRMSSILNYLVRVVASGQHLTQQQTQQKSHHKSQRKSQ